MTRAVRAVAAVLGLLLLAAPLGAGPLRAQTTTTAPGTCPVVAEAFEEDRIRYERASPPGQPPLQDAAVDVGAVFWNVADAVGPREPVLQRIDGRIIACRSRQLLPSESEASVTNPDDENRPLMLGWSPVFETNGTYAIVFEAAGRRPTGVTSYAEQRRVVVQHITVAVPPKAPTNVAVSDPANGVVTVSWDYVDPEPDLLGFDIQRSRQGSGGYSTIENGIVDPRVRSVSDAPPTGAWSYRVVAYRAEVADGTASRSDSVEVVEPAPPADDNNAAGGATGSGSGSSQGSNRGSGPDGSSTTLGGAATGSSGATRSSVDLSDFAAALNARRSAPRARVDPPDPGFNETLPFDAPGQLEIEEDLREDPEELGADAPNVGLGQRPIADPGERQRSLGFVAFGLLLFVLSMTGLFVKSEVKRADLLELDPIDGAAPDTEIAAAVEPRVPPVIAAAVVPRRRRTRDRGPLEPVEDAEPIAAPKPEPILAAPRRRRTRTDDAPPPTAARAATATTRGSAVEIPETRRRWSGRPVAAPTTAVHDEAGHHDFADLAESPVPTRTGDNATTARRRPRAEESPLDAPGLDVPDPAPMMAAGRPSRRPPRAQAALPARKAATSASRTRATASRR